MNYHVLLVEDDLDLASTLIDYLELESIHCDHASNGLAGLQLLSQQPFDVIILDVNMPRMNGLSMCKAMREQGSETPVLMLTARDTLDDKLAGFDAGSDDYLVKPFEMLELVARLQVLAKRRSGQSPLLQCFDLSMNCSKKEVMRGHRVLKLSPTGWTILECLMRRAPNVVPRSQLVQAVWGDEQPDSNSLKVHLFKLRQQVEQAGEAKLLHTIAGVGVALRQGKES